MIFTHKKNILENRRKRNTLVKICLTMEMYKENPNKFKVLPGGYGLFWYNNRDNRRERIL